MFSCIFMIFLYSDVKYDQLQALYTAVIVDNLVDGTRKWLQRYGNISFIQNREGWIICTICPSKKKLTYLCPQKDV